MSVWDEYEGVVLDGQMTIFDYTEKGGSHGKERKMLLMDALSEIEKRIRLILTDYIADKDFQKSKDYDSIRNYYQALLVAKKCIEAQMDLASMLDDFETDKEDDTYSHGLVREMLQSVYAGEKVEE